MSTPPESLPPEPQAAPSPASAPTVRPAFEGALERVATELLRQQRSERRWRIFFRLAWLLLVASAFYVLAAGRASTSAPSGPHTALVEVRGEIDSESEASAESLVAALGNGRARSHDAAGRA